MIWRRIEGYLCIHHPHSYVWCCDEEDGIERAAEKMRRNNVCRLVVNRGKRVTGIVTQAKLLCASGNRHKGDKVLHELVKPQQKMANAYSTLIPLSLSLIESNDFHR